MYRLTQKAINAINDSRPESIKALAATTVLNLSEISINRIIRENEPNGDLTKKAALEVIRKVTRLKDSEILEDVVHRVAV